MRTHVQGSEVTNVNEKKTIKDKKAVVYALGGRFQILKFIFKI